MSCLVQLPTSKGTLGIPNVQRGGDVMRSTMRSVADSKVVHSL